MTGTIMVVSRGIWSDDLAGWLRDQPSEYHVVRVRGLELIAQRNIAVAHLRGDWAFLIDADCSPPDDVIPRMLAHHQGVVGGVIIEPRGDLDVCAIRTFEPTVRWRLDELPFDGLLPVLACGTGCLLVRREVFDAIGFPWFRCGRLVADFLAEDTEFCLRAAECGYPTYLDCSVRVGHAVRPILWPHPDGDVWIQWAGSPYRQPLEAVA